MLFLKLYVSFANSPFSTHLSRIRNYDWQGKENQWLLLYLSIFSDAVGIRLQNILFICTTFLKIATWQINRQLVFPCVYVHLDIKTLFNCQPSLTDKNCASISIKHIQASGTFSLWALTKPRSWAFKKERQGLFWDTKPQLNICTPPDLALRPQRLFSSPSKLWEAVRNKKSTDKQRYTDPETKINSWTSIG